MRKLVNWLVILAAVCFGFGVLRCVLAFPQPIHYLSPEAYWRGAVGLLLFAITLLLMDRPKAP